MRTDYSRKYTPRPVNGSEKYILNTKLQSELTMKACGQGRTAIPIFCHAPGFYLRIGLGFPGSQCFIHSPHACHLRLPLWGLPPATPPVEPVPLFSLALGVVVPVLLAAVLVAVDTRCLLDHSIWNSSCIVVAQANSQSIYMRHMHIRAEKYWYRLALLVILH